MATGAGTVAATETVTETVMATGAATTGDGDGDEDDDGGMLPDAGAPVNESVFLVGLALLVGGMVVMNTTQARRTDERPRSRQES